MRDVILRASEALPNLRNTPLRPLRYAGCDFRGIEQGDAFLRYCFAGCGDFRKIGTSVIAGNSTN
jgi:hypothetical protein